VAFDLPAEEVDYGATGGDRVPQEILKGLIDRIRAAAEKNGYPTGHREEQKRQFDLDVTRLLLERMEVSPHEASVPAVWHTFTCVFLPDLVRWRFPHADPESPRALDRFLNPVRNCFGRLWRRAFLLRDAGATDPLHLVASLSEDQFLHLVERPYLAGNRRLALLMGRACVGLKSTRRDDIMQDAAKRLRRLASVLSLETMSDENLQRTVESAFRESQSAVLGPEPSRPR
jgi:hypothetical protein